MKPTRAELENTLGDCVDILASGGSKFPALCYEDGVAAAIEYALGIKGNPLEE